MNGLPYYKAYPRDFIEGTIGMSFELKGAYRLVLDLIYMQGGRLPDDARYISGLLGCSVRKWNAFRDELIESGKLVVTGNFLTNYRAEKELETLGKLQEKQSKNASRPKKIKGLRKPRQDHTEPDISSSLRSEDNIPAHARETGPGDALATTLDAEHVAAVIEHRKRLRKPLTAHAARLLAGKFSRCPDPNGAADAMIANGWQGFEPEWLDQRGRSTGPPQRQRTVNGFAAAFLDMQQENHEPADHYRNGQAGTADGRPGTRQAQREPDLLDLQRSGSAGGPFTLPDG